MKENLNFGQAIEALKQGQTVARKGWNGKGMFLFFVSGSVVEQSINEAYGDKGKTPNTPIIDAIYMKTADDKAVPWLASQTDMLSEDWEIVE
ncbi:MAG: DUF2829 domain-containing protein [Gammaproteobacteria bacterium]|nr:DUF2829 domain-containing protein [Gammaproteobacteria bacterium]